MGLTQILGHAPDDRFIKPRTIPVSSDVIEESIEEACLHGRVALFSPHFGRQLMVSDNDDSITRGMKGTQRLLKSYRSARNGTQPAHLWHFYDVLLGRFLCRKPKAGLENSGLNLNLEERDTQSSIQQDDKPRCW